MAMQTFSTQDASQDLNRAGFTEPQAKALVNILFQINDGVPAKQFIEQQLHALQGRIITKIRQALIASVLVTVGANYAMLKLMLT